MHDASKTETMYHESLLKVLSKDSVHFTEVSYQLLILYRDPSEFHSIGTAGSISNPSLNTA